MESFHGPYGIGEDELGAVDEGQSFFWAQLEGRHAQPVENLFRGIAAALVKDLAQTDQGQEKVGQGGQVAGGADRSFFGDDGQNVIFKMPGDALQGLQLYTGKASCQRVHFCDEHDAGDVGGYGVTDPYAMTLEDLMLQGEEVAGGDPRVGQDAKAGVHTVYGAVIIGDGSDILLTGPDVADGLVRKDPFLRAFGKCDRIGDCKMSYSIMEAIVHTLYLIPKVYL